MDFTFEVVMYAFVAMLGLSLHVFDEDSIVRVLVAMSIIGIICGLAGLARFPVF